MGELVAFEPPFEQQVNSVCTYWFRTHSGSTCYLKYGYLVSTQISRVIFRFSDWVIYPEGDQILEDHSDSLISLVTSHCGRYVFTGTAKGLMTQWDLRIPLVTQHLEVGPLLCLDSVPSEKGSTLLATGGPSGSIKLWIVDGQHRLHRDLTCSSMDGIIFAVRFDESGHTLFAAVSMQGIRVISVDTGMVIRVVGGIKSIHNLEVVRGSSLLISANLIGEWVEVWDTQKDDIISSEQSVTLDKRTVISDLSLSCDSRMLAVATSPIHVLQWPELKVVSQIYERGTSVAFHPSIGYCLAVAYPDTLELIDLRGGTIARKYDERLQKVRRVRFTVDGSRLISIGYDEKIRIWDVSSVFNDSFH